HSDLYPRWYGARELLLRGRDPYSAEVEAEMRRGSAGRDVAPGEVRGDVPVFAHPAYTAFLLAPLTLTDFPLARGFAQWTFPLLIVLGTLLWVAALGAQLTLLERAGVAALALGAPATLYAGTLQQLTAIVYALIAGAVYLIARRRYGWAGVLLALST